MVYGIYPRCYEAEPSNPEGIPYTTASEESMWLVPELTAFHQSQAEKSIPLGNTFGLRQLREQRLEKCGLCPIPANTKYFQNIFKRTEKKILETFTINMNKTLAKCSITIGKTLVK